MIQIKRTYEPPARGDGRRILVERLWPRGLKKEALAADAWVKEVAPSTELRKWFDHRVELWEEFQRRYRNELDSNPAGWEPILDASKRGRVTLLYSAHDTLHNGALILRDYLLELLERGGKGSPAASRRHPGGVRCAACERRARRSARQERCKTMSATAKWPVYSLKLRSRSEVAERTLELRFDKPERMTFKAGQFMDLTLIDPPETDAEGNTRGYSINSAPDDPELMFTTRLRDTAFKRVLRTMALGTEVKVEGPFGNLTLHNNASRPAILLAGGIGITPFRSIVRWAAHQKLPHRILLFYANRRPEDAPFLDELGALARENSRFTVIPTMTRMGDSRQPWDGETGYISHELIEKYLKRGPAPGQELSGPIYYMAGPPAMLAGLRAMLNNAGIDDDDIRSEEFAGY